VNKKQLGLAAEIVLEISTAGVDMDDYLDVQDHFTANERKWVEDNWDQLERLANNDGMYEAVQKYVKENWE